MPSLDDLGTKQVVTETPASGDFLPFLDISEFGASTRVKRSTVEAMVTAGLTPGAVTDALEGETIAVDGIIPADTAGVALADGVIGWNETLGGWVRHDGTTIGGILLVPMDPWYSKGATIVLGATLATDQLTELARFPITSAQAVAGKRFLLSGTYTVSFNGTRPVSCYIGLVSEADEAIGLGVIHGDDLEGNTISAIVTSLYCEIVLTSQGDGTYLMGQQNHSSVRNTRTGATTALAVTTSAYNQPAVGQPFGVAQDLILQVQTSATVAASSMQVMWDLKLEATN